MNTLYLAWKKILKGTCTANLDPGSLFIASLATEGG